MNSQLYIILIPTKEQVYDHFYKEVCNEYNIDTSFVDLEMSSFILNDITSRHGLVLIDPLNDFRKDSINCYFEVDEHLNSRGHLVLANVICRKMLEELKN